MTPFVSVLFCFFGGVCSASLSEISSSSRPTCLPIYFLLGSKLEKFTLLSELSDVVSTSSGVIKPVPIDARTQVNSGGISSSARLLSRSTYLFFPLLIFFLMSIQRTRCGVSQSGAVVSLLFQHHHRQHSQQRYRCSSKPMGVLCAILL